METPDPVLILPGLYNSGPDHWQSLWESRHAGFRRVVQHDWEAPLCSNWVQQLEAVVATSAEAPVLVAHSSACALIAHWAGGHDGRRVRGALLAAPQRS